MMDNELFELCKKVYEKTNWRLPISVQPVEYWVQHDGEWDLEYGVAGMPTDGGIVPLYNSDYLLHKLPTYTKRGNYLTMDILEIPSVTRDYSFGYAAYGEMETPVGTANTPLKALLKLTIALADANELQPKAVEGNE